MQTKLDPRSLLLGACIGAVAVLCVAAVQPKTNSVAGGEAAGKELEQVAGIGGVFFKAKDPKGLVAWYRTNLGVRAQGGFANFDWREKERPEEIGHTAWRIFPTNSAYWGAGTSPLMVNYRVASLDRMLAQLRRNGVSIEKVENYDYGRWAWITDPEGNRMELWESARGVREPAAVAHGGAGGIAAAGPVPERGAVHLLGIHAAGEVG